MPRYASFDPNAAQPTPVIGWYDTGALYYPQIPPPASLMEVTDPAMWASRHTTPYVQNGALVAPPPAPPPSPAEQALALLAGGLTVTCRGTPAASGRYATSDAAVSRYTAVQTRLNAGKGFPPQNAATIAWVDMAGGAHTLTPALFTEIAAAVSDFVFACDLVILGASATLPPNTCTIP